MKVLKSVTVRRLLLVLVSVTLTFILIELPPLINVLDYRPIVGPVPSDLFAASNLSDPELLHIHPPYMHYSGAARGGDFTKSYRIPRPEMTLFRWDLSYDHNGFRNDHDLKSADLVVIGDSFVEGPTIPHEQLMTSILARLQGEVVANLGQYFYGPLQELVVLKRYGLPLQPRTVVWMFYEGNDLWDVIHYHSVMRRYHNGITTKQDLPKPKPHSWSAFLERSFTRNAYRQLRAQYMLFLRPSGATRSGIIQAPNGQELKVYFLDDPETLSEWQLGALDETTRTLATAHQLCEAHGAHLVFVFVPVAFRVLHTLCRFPPESKSRKWVPNDLPDRFKKAVGAISPDIGYLDLTPYLTDAANQGVIPYYVDDDHWSPAGQKIAAEAINDYLLSSRGRLRSQCEGHLPGIGPR